METRYARVLDRDVDNIVQVDARSISRALNREAVAVKHYVASLDIDRVERAVCEKVCDVVRRYNRRTYGFNASIFMNVDYASCPDWSNVKHQRCHV
jgi:hypothetical protein